MLASADLYSVPDYFKLMSTISFQGEFGHRTLKIEHSIENRKSTIDNRGYSLNYV